MSTRWEDFTFAGSPIKRRIGFDSVEQKIVFESNQPNLQECLDMNRALANADRKSTRLWQPGDDEANYVKVASIPLHVLERWKVEEDIDFLRWNEDDKARITRRLNDFNEWGDLRTAPGQI